MKQTKGILFAALSAVLFGLGPTISQQVFDGGGNAVTTVFLRSAVAVPLLLGYLLFQKISLRLTKEQWRDLLLLGVFGVAGTGFTSMSAITYISGGLATTLHFIYPALTALAGCILFRERLGGVGVTALAVITGGVVLFSADTAAVQPLGVALALASGVTYAFYAVYLERSSLRGLNLFALNLYLMAVSALTYGVIGLCSGTLSVSSLTPRGWGFALVNTVFCLAAFVLFQLGVRYAGATSSSMMSALEPATSVLFGFLVAGDRLSGMELMGCGAVLVGILLILPAKNHQKAVVLEG